MRSKGGGLAVRLLAMIAGSLMVLACGSGRGGSEDREEEPAAVAPEPTAAGDQPLVARVVGEIASVHREEDFVLIKRMGLRALPAGGAYSSISKDGRTASLQLTGERLGRHYAADIREGEPAPGDLVIVRPLPVGSQPAVTPAGPQAPKIGPQELRRAPGTENR